MFVVNCGSGIQKIRWLADVAVHRYEHFYNVDLGVAHGVKYDTGDILNMDDTVSEKLSNDSHVWVMLKGHFI